MQPLCRHQWWNNDDLRRAVELIEKGVINPSAMITHVGGLNSVLIPH